MEVSQYSIVLVNLNPSAGGEQSGAEIRKLRPCVVISPDEMNRNLRTIVIVPMTTTSRAYPTRARVSHNQKIVWIVVDQLMTVDRKHLVKSVGNLSKTEIRKLKELLNETYVA